MNPLKFCRRVALAVLMFGVGLTISGCGPNRAEEVARNLGDYQYVGLSPKVLFKVLKIEFTEPKNEYQKPRLKVIGVAQQQDAFPLSHYQAGLSVSVKIDGVKVGAGQLAGDMKQGNLAFSADIYLSDFPTTQNLNVKNIELVKEGFTWWPIPTADGGAELQIATD